MHVLTVTALDLGSKVLFEETLIYQNRSGDRARYISKCVQCNCKTLWDPCTETIRAHHCIRERGALR